MNSNLKTIGEISNRVFSGGTPDTSNPEFWNGDIPWLSSGETSESFIRQTKKTITQIGVDNSSTKLAHKGNIVIASAGQGWTRGQVSYLEIDTYVNQSLIVIDVNVNIANPKYVYYNLLNRYDELRQISDGSSIRGSLTTKIISNLKINMPSLTIQQHVANILFNIDKIILNNKKINDYLEHICNMKYCELFSLQDKTGTLSDLGTIVGGSTPSKDHSEYYTNNGIAWLTPKDLSMNHEKFIQHGAIDLTKEGLNNSSCKLMPRGSILFSSRAPIGYIAITSGEVCTNQGFKSIVPKDWVGSAYIYYFLKNNLDSIMSQASGSTFMEVSGSQMKSINVTIPNKDDLDMFNSFVEPFFAYQEIIESENQKLSIVRDILLPRLIFEEIDVSNFDTGS